MSRVGPSDENFGIKDGTPKDGTPKDGIRKKGIYKKGEAQLISKTTLQLSWKAMKKHDDNYTPMPPYTHQNGRSPNIGKLTTNTRSLTWNTTIR